MLRSPPHCRSASVTHNFTSHRRYYPTIRISRPEPQSTIGGDRNCSVGSDGFSPPDGALDNNAVHWFDPAEGTALRANLQFRVQWINQVNHLIDLLRGLGLRTGRGIVRRGAVHPVGFQFAARKGGRDNWCGKKERTLNQDRKLFLEGIILHLPISRR